MKPIRKRGFASRVWGSRLAIFRMQKTNYQFEKRRREMEKKAKKEEKRRLKLESAQTPVAGDATTPANPVKPA
jgi:hypothetical protein